MPLPLPSRSAKQIGLLLAFCLALLGTNLTSNAQQVANIRISGNFTNTPVKQLIENLESQHPVFFFYNEEWLEEIRVSGQLDDVPLVLGLTQLLKGTGLSFEVYQNQYIVLVKEGEAQAISGSEGQSGKVNPFYRSNNIRTETFGQPGDTPAGEPVTLSGIITEGRTGEAMISARIYFKELKTGTVTNLNGFYSISVPQGVYTVTFDFLGMDTEEVRINLYKDGKLSLGLFESTTKLEEIVVTGEQERPLATVTQMSTNRLGIQEIKKVPALLGEVDVVRAITLLPGVTTVGEAASGFNVRGGNVSQNLVLLDKAPLFNSSHVFGFFSVFNPEVVKETRLFKGGIPSRYGGRIASVLEVTQKEGNTKKLSGSGGAGIISSRAMLEGPIGKSGNTTFLVGGRGSYASWLLQELRDPDLSQSEAGFYDANAKIVHRWENGDKLSASGYYSSDRFRLANDTLYQYSSLASSVTWSHIFSPKLASSFSAIYSNYQYNIDSEDEANGFNLRYDIDFASFKADFSYFTSPRHTIDAGVEINYYGLSPGDFDRKQDPTNLGDLFLPREQGRELGVYISDLFNVSANFSIEYGLRYSVFQPIGQRDVLEYVEDRPRTQFTVIDTTSYAAGEVIATYGGFEPRLGLRYQFSANDAIKLSYNRTRQYIHLISNTTAITPLDIWKLSDFYLGPQIGDQIALGLTRSIPDKAIEASVELYYKRIQDIVEYKPGAQLVINPILETELVRGTGTAYGAEILLEKKQGRLNGWASYTYSRSFSQVEETENQEAINEGRRFANDFDKPHDVTFALNYQASRRVNVALNFNYSTGRPTSLPSSRYEFDGITVAHFPERNNARIPDYHRLDLSVTLASSLYREKKVEASWTLGIYNVYGRNNAYSVFFDRGQGQPLQAFQLAVIGTPLPSLTYNFKF